MTTRLSCWLFVLLVACGEGPASVPASSTAAGSTPSTSTTGAGGASSSTTSASSGSGASATALLTEDFENGAVDASVWSEQINSGGTLSVDTAYVHGGSYALHAAHTGFSTMLRTSAPAVFPADRLYGRVWLFVEGALPNVHVIWVEMGTLQNDGEEVRIGMNAGQLDVNHWPGDEDMRDPEAPIMASTWHCLEFMVDGIGQSLEVRFDGVARPALSTTDWVADDPANGNQNPLSNWSPPYEAVRFGWELGQGDIWYDDIALGHDAWLGCD